MKLNESSRTFTVRYTRPKTVTYKNAAEPKIWDCNHCSVVVAMNAVEAVNAVVNEWPDANVLSVQPGPIGQTLITESCLQ